MRKLNHSASSLKFVLDLTKLKIGNIPLSKNLDALRDMKGFFLCTTHKVFKDLSVENIKALWKDKCIVSDIKIILVINGVDGHL